MKINALIFIGIISSVGLAGTFAYYYNTGGALNTQGHEVEALSPPAVPVPRPVAASEIPRFFTNTVRVNWSQVESDDYRKYIANLRAIGCPEETVRDIIIADVNKMFAERERALGGAPEKFEFWKRQVRRGISEDKVKERIQLAKEKRGLLKDLLGVEIEDKTPLTGSSDGDDRLGFLSKEKQNQVRELQATLQAKVQSLMGNRLRPTKEDIASYLQMVGESEAEAQKVLTPEEFENYQLATSQTANMMRATMGEFEMTEQEFREVYKIRKQFDEQYGPRVSSMEEPAKVLARAQMEDKVRTAMGDERYTQYNRETSWATSSIQGVAQQYGIPKETAVKVFDIKPLAEEQAAKVQLDAALTEMQKAEALQAVQQLTMKNIAEVLGKEPAEAYYRQGAWIKNLVGQK